MPPFASTDILLLPTILLLATIITYAVYLLGELAHETSHILAIYATKSTLTDITINKPTGLRDPLFGVRIHFKPNQNIHNSQRLVAAAPWIILGPAALLQLYNTLHTPNFHNILLVLAFVIALLPNRADYNAYKNA